MSIEPARAEALESVQSTFDHIRRISDRRRTLAGHQLTAEEQALHRIGSAHTAGILTDTDVVALYQEYRGLGDPGFSIRWDAHVTLTAKRIEVSRRNGSVTPNGPDGSWHGEGRPFGSDPCPMVGTSVVYVLYDDSWTPVYVGSTGKFRDRIKSHVREKVFTYWRAWPCRDRAHAYQREAEMLNEVMPHLNRRREGRRSA